MKQPLFVTALALALVLTLVSGTALAQNAEVEAFSGFAVTNLDGTVAPGNFPPLANAFGAAPRELRIECFVIARQFGTLLTSGNSNVSATLGGQLVDLVDAALLGNLPEKTNAIGSAGVARFSWGTFDFEGDFADPDALGVGVSVTGSLSGSVTGGVDQVTVKCRALKFEACTRSGNNACFLPSSRFQAYVLTANGSRASVTSNPPGSSTATFSVGGGTATASLSNSCVPGGNNHFWVTLKSTTSAAFTLVVEDTGSGEVVSYANMPGTDKAAFPTCPP